MLMKDEVDKQHFLKLLDSSPSAASLILKMEADSKSLLFLTPVELEDMVKEFKSI